MRDYGVEVLDRETGAARVIPVVAASVEDAIEQTTRAGWVVGRVTIAVPEPSALQQTNGSEAVQREMLEEMKRLADAVAGKKDSRGPFERFLEFLALGLLIAGFLFWPLFLIGGALAVVIVFRRWAVSLFRACFR